MEQGRMAWLPMVMCFIKMKLKVDLQFEHANVELLFQQFHAYEKEVTV